MKRKLAVILMIWIGFLLQTAVFPRWEFLAATPNVLLAVTVSIGFIEGSSGGLLTGFFSGLLLDLFRGGTCGLYALLYLLIGWYAGRYSKVYFDEDIKIPLFLTAVSDLFSGCLIYIAGFLLRGRLNFGGYFVQIILPETVSTLVLTLILYRPICRVNHSMVEKEKKGRQSLWIRE